jgi:hypothetical protein
MRRAYHPLAMRRQLLAARKGVHGDRGVVDPLDAALPPGGEDHQQVGAKSISPHQPEKRGSASGGAR